jgi:hypothetical protein
VLVPRRHITTVAGLTDDEAAAPGSWQVRLSRALHEVTGCAKTLRHAVHRAGRLRPRPLPHRAAHAGHSRRPPSATSWGARPKGPNFTNPDARAWYAAKLRALVDMGGADRRGLARRLRPGADAQNYYPQIYHQVVFDVLREARGAGKAVLSRT